MSTGRRFDSRAELRSVVFDFAHDRCEWPASTVYSYTYRPVDGVTCGGLADRKQWGEAESVRCLLSELWPMVPSPDQSTEERLGLLLLEGLQPDGECPQVVVMGCDYNPRRDIYEVRGQSRRVDSESDAPSRSGASSWSVVIDAGTRSSHQRGQGRQQARELDGVELGGPFEVALRTRTGRCPDSASELAHIVSSGMGGDPKHSRDTVDNVFAACPAHARVSDGLPPPGGGYEERDAEYVKIPGLSMVDDQFGAVVVDGLGMAARTSDVLRAFARWLWLDRAARKLRGDCG